MIETTVQQHDKRLDKIDESIEKLVSEMSTIKQKIFNGYDKSIKSTENKVNYIDEHNSKQHAELKEDVKELSKKMDKLLWKLVGITFFAMLASIFMNLMGWI